MTPLPVPPPPEDYKFDEEIDSPQHSAMRSEEEPEKISKSEKVKLARMLEAKLGTAIEKQAVVSIATNSLREIIKAFDGNIIELEANASVESSMDRNHLQELGAKFCLRDKTSFYLSYGSARHVSLSPVWLQRLWDAFNTHHLVDATVTRLRMVIESTELARIARELGFKNINPKELKWVAEFVTEPCESDIDRNRFLSFPYNTDLVKRFHFKHSVMNLKTLVSYEHYTSFAGKYPQHTSYVINWTSEIMKNRYSPEAVAHDVKISLGQYGMLKRYKLEGEDKLILIGIK